MFSKGSTLRDIEAVAASYQHLTESDSNPLWEEALRDTLLEYALVKDLPDDKDFIVRRAQAISLFGLDRAAQDRLDRASRLPHIRDC